MTAWMSFAVAAVLIAMVGVTNARSQQEQGSPERAPGHHGDTSGHAAGAGQGMEAGAPDDSVSNAYLEAMERMHREMAVELTGDAERDFAQAMIPHHQGAIDMARIFLEHGKDPELRELAERVIQEQEKEIRQMRAWLDRHPAAR